MGLYKNYKAKKDIIQAAYNIINSIPVYTPKQIETQIKKSGYVGQEIAVKAVSLMAYRHITRLRKIFIQHIQPTQLPPKTNMLFVGPTGCGKTYLIELLFRNILKLPTAIVDMTSYSETGYVGQDVSSIITRLLYSADLNVESAAFGIICLDEFDKLASGQNNAVFAGAGTTKDVSGLGVQRELLKMLEATEIAVPIELSHSDYAPKTVVSSEHIAFIACGAFSGLKGLIETSYNYHIGFGRTAMDGGQDKIAVDYSVDEVEVAKNFMNFGFLPELIGRFKRFVPFSALTRDQLKEILISSVLKQYKKEFKLEGIELIVDEKLLDLVITQSVKKETGARGLESTLLRYLEDAAFEAYSTAGAKKVNIFIENDGVGFAVT
jgi:ATP-dependent Clp protease ATP-binding subunit ClpX